MKKFLALLLVLMMLAVLASCGNNGAGTQPANPAESADPETEDAAGVSERADPAAETGAPTVLKIGAESEIVTLNPTEGLDLIGSGSTICGELYEPLFYRDDDKSLIPGLASGYEWKDDNTLVVTLNEGITFHNGNDFTAEDVLFSLAQYAGNAKFSERFVALDVENSYAEGDYTVVLKTTNYTSVLEAALGSYQVVMMDKDWYEENEGNIDRIENGTGPYVMTEWRNGVGIFMEKNDNYWGGDVGYYDEVQVLFFSDATTAVLEYQTGNLDICYVQNATDIQSLMAGEWENTQVVRSAVHKINVVSMSRVLGDEFADGTLAEAICYAIPVEELVAGALNNASTPQDSIVAQSDAAYTSIGFYEYNPDYARELVEKYKADHGLDECVITMVNVDSATMNALGEAIQGYLADVGINMILDIGQGSDVIPRYIAGEVNLAITSAGGGFDSCDAFTSIQSGSAPLGALPDEEVLELIEQAKVTKDEVERNEIYAQVQQLVHDRFLALPLCEGYTYYAVRDGITMDLGCYPQPVVVDIYPTN